VSGDTGSAAAPLPDYSAPGPFAVGTYDTQITGSTGVGLKVQVWFPADEAGDGTVNYDGLYGGGATTGAVANCAESRPVMLFSHGNNGIRWQSAYLAEHLVSHGYVVVAPDHTFNTFLDYDNDKFEDVLFRRPQDIFDSFDWAVAQSDDASSAIAGCIDEAAGYSVSGHSFGGYTAYAAAGARLDIPDGGGTMSLGDDRVWAAVTLAPWNAYVLNSGTEEIDVPVMCLSGTRDEITTWRSVTNMYDALTVTPRYLGEFPDAGHYSFSPIACEFGLTGDGCGEAFIPLEEFTGLVNTAVVSFLEETQGRTGAIGQLPESDSLLWESTQ
jgi:predicted dienelactone hydrolase